MARKNPAPKPETGVVYAQTNGTPPSSVGVSRAIFSAAAQNVDPRLAASIASERDWRRRYPRGVVSLTGRALHSPDAALTISRDGLAEASKHFGFRRDGESLSLASALARFEAPRFHTGLVRGEGRRATELEIPYLGQTLRGAALRTQLQSWVDRDVIEPCARDAMFELMDTPRWLDLSDMNIALLGAGAEVGPLGLLTAHGANLWAVDLPNPATWQRIFDVARAGSGTLRFPTSAPTTESMSDAALAGLAGADLLADAPEIRTWLLEADEPLAIGAYAYLGGKTFVRVSVAMDAIMTDVAARRPETAFAWLLTPTDTYGVPADAAERSAERLRSRPIMSGISRAYRRLSRGRYCVPNIVEPATSRMDGRNRSAAPTRTRSAIAATMISVLRRRRISAWASDSGRPSAAGTPAFSIRAITSRLPLRLFRDG